MPEALTPSLTDYDRLVLAAVPEGGRDPWRVAGRTLTQLASVWEIGEALDELDVVGLVRELRGLEHLGYVTRARCRVRNREVWWRTSRGDEALDA